MPANPAWPRPEPRHDWLPPRYPVKWQPHCRANWWKTVAPLPIFTDVFSEEVSRRKIDVRLAIDDDALWLRAVVSDRTPTMTPDITPDDGRFWRQDHIEFRFLPQPWDPDHQVQFILTPHGKFYDSLGLWQKDTGIRVSAAFKRGRWHVHVCLPFADLGVRPWRPGMTFKGVLAHVRWADDHPDIAAITTTSLGFAQAEQFAEFPITLENNILLERVEFPAGPLEMGTNRVRLHLRRRVNRKVSGWLRIEEERGPMATGRSHIIPCELPPRGRKKFSFDFNLDRPGYRRYRIWFVSPTKGGLELGAVTLRAAAEPIARFRDAPDRRLAHPYLYFDEVGLPAFRAKLKNRFLKPLVKMLKPTRADFDDSFLPDPDEPLNFDFDERSMNWFRVAKESMLRGGEQGGNAAHQRIWQCLSPEAQEAFRDIRRTVKTSPEQMGILLPALNDLLRRRDLYTADAFDGVHLPPEGHELLKRGVDELDADELVKLNRILFQSSVECCSKFGTRYVSQAGSYLSKWLHTGDQRLIDLASRAVKVAADIMIPDAAFHLHEGNSSTTLALSYDTFYPHLTDEQRADWQRLLTKLLDLYLQTARAWGWTVTCIPNANPVGSAGGGMLALALWREEPDKAREALAYARKYVWSWLDWCAGYDGGNTEGMQYWTYGTTSFLRFALLLERLGDSDHGLLTHPAIRNTMNMVRLGITNDGAMHGVNDTIPSPCGGEIAWVMAGRMHDPFALWYGDHCLRWNEQAKTEGRKTPYSISPMWGILYRPDKPERLGQHEPLPVAYALRSIEYATIRSGTDWFCKWTAGLKGSRPHYTHHNQPDTGSFYVHLKGERLLIDPGYYKSPPTEHCLPLIDGKGPVQPNTYTGRIAACQAIDDLRYAAVNATPAYEGAAREVKRLLVMVGEEGLILLDDIVPTKVDAVVTNQFQCGGPTRELKKNAWTIQGRQVKLRLELFGPAVRKLTFEDERSLKDTHWGYAFATCRHFPVTADYTAINTKPLVTIIADATDGLRRRSRVSYAGGNVTVTMPSGRKVVFEYRRNRWILQT